jgi:hypothetical protein
MLTAPGAESVVDADAPLSVVVIGGKNTLGAMPFVHQSLHEDSYRRFFAGLEALQEEARIDVYYKPKGRIGENEAWLERVVGDSARWQGIISHPLKIALPNMLFVSISVGSGALLEGLARGIPCVIVKDFPAREYLALAPDVISTGPVDEILEIVKACTESGGLTRFTRQQLERFAYETGHADISELNGIRRLDVMRDSAGQTP